MESSNISGGYKISCDTAHWYKMGPGARVSGGGGGARGLFTVTSDEMGYGAGLRNEEMKN